MRKRIKEKGKTLVERRFLWFLTGGKSSVFVFERWLSATAKEKANKSQQYSTLLLFFF